MASQTRNVHTAGRKPLPIPNDLKEMYELMTQAQLSQHYKVSRTTINKWLRNSNIYIKQK